MTWHLEACCETWHSWFSISDYHSSKYNIILPGSSIFFLTNEIINTVISAS